MTTDYDYRYSQSPPVSPKSQPHGLKRKASSQEDELENQSLISTTFKKLRLSKSTRHSTPRAHVLRSEPDDANPSAAVDLPPVGASYRHVMPSDVPSAPYSNYGGHDEDDSMRVDDTADRIWVHDLDAEIAEIEAEEAKEREAERIKLSEAGIQYAKIPDHLWKQNNHANDPASNMQMILYQDPISISVPAEDDAVRKTIVEARKRIRENQPQKEQQGKPLLLASASDVSDFSGRLQNSNSRSAQDDIDMELD